MNGRTTLTRALFRFADVLARIKAPRRIYRMTWTEDGIEHEPNGWMWLSCAPSMWLLRQAVRLDRRRINAETRGD